MSALAINGDRGGALVGFGRVAEFAHLPALLAHPNLTLHSIVDPDARRRRHARQLLGDSIRTYATMTELLCSERPTFVDVAAPPRRTRGRHRAGCGPRRAPSRGKAASV